MEPYDDGAISDSVCENLSNHSSRQDLLRSRKSRRKSALKKKLLTKVIQLDYPNIDFIMETKDSIQNTKHGRRTHLSFTI
jgi:hypothetical protein